MQVNRNVTLRYHFAGFSRMLNYKRVVVKDVIVVFSPNEPPTKRLNEGCIAAI